MQISFKDGKPWAVQWHNEDKEVGGTELYTEFLDNLIEQTHVSYGINAKYHLVEPGEKIKKRFEGKEYIQNDWHTWKNLELILPTDWANAEPESKGWKQTEPLAFLKYWGDEGTSKQTKDGQIGFLGTPFIQNYLKKYEEMGFACEGIFSDVCYFPAGIWVQTIPDKEYGLCRPGFYFSYKLWTCLIEDPDPKAQCNCPLACNEVYTECGTGYTTQCHGIVKGTSKCLPVAFEVDNKTEEGEDWFNYEVCDASSGAWITMNQYQKLVLDPAEKHRFQLNTGNNKGRKTKMCQRPDY